MEFECPFSDPGYGGLTNYEGRAADTGSVQPHQKESIYRFDMNSSKLHKVSDESFKPNGVCFSPDYKKFYAADTGASHYGAVAPAVIREWVVVDESRLDNGRLHRCAGSSFLLKGFKNGSRDQAVDTSCRITIFYLAPA